MSNLSEQLLLPSLITDSVIDTTITNNSCKSEYNINSQLYNIMLEFLGHSTNIQLNNITYKGYKYNSKRDDDFGFKFKAYLPFDMDIFVKFNDHDYKIIRTKIGDVVGTQGAAMIFELLTVYANSKAHLDELTHWAIMHAEKGAKTKPDRSTIDIYIYENGFWNHMTTQTKRSIDTIYLDDNAKNKTIFDIKHFINNKSTYEKFGIQYKRSYLFTGPPGTGKSSLIYALASLYDFNIGIFKVSAEKRSLESAIKSIPKNTVLLMEDIEHVFPTKDQNREHKGINESDILNSLNGTFYKSGLLIFLTANNINRISKKILRPGRVDYRLKFDYCTREQIKTIYKTFITDGDADVFCDKVKMIQLTPAVLQTVLFNRQNEDAIQNLSGITGKKRKRDIIDELIDLVEETKEEEIPFHYQ